MCLLVHMSIVINTEAVPRRKFNRQRALVQAILSEPMGSGHVFRRRSRL